MTTSTTKAPKVFKPGTHAHTLLVAFKKAGRKGMTALEAGEYTSLYMTGYWKRVSDLRRAGLIEATGKTRLVATGMNQQVLRITAEGREHLARKK